MTKILFLFFEGLPTSVIDSQVLGHCQQMQSNLNVEFEIWSFACNDTLYKNSLERLTEAEKLAGCKVRLFKGIRPAYPFSEYFNAKVLKEKIKEFNINYNLIHARTDYSAHVASLVTKNFIWDCRGDTLAEFNSQYKCSKNYFGKMYKHFKIKKNITNAKKGKKALFVSNFLRNKHKHSKESYVIGCMADTSIFFFDNKLRENVRQELGVTKEEKLLIYSGGMAHYQKFSKTVEIFMKLPKDWKFIILTNGLEYAQKELEKIPQNRYILKNVSFKEVNSYLNAADVGIMLRDLDDLNKAASPTKYAEYSMSGLYIIYSDHIGDLEMYEQTIQNRQYLETINTIDLSIEKRKQRFKTSCEMLSKNNALKKYKGLYDI